MRTKRGTGCWAAVLCRQTFGKLNQSSKKWNGKTRKLIYRPIQQNAFPHQHLYIWTRSNPERRKNGNLKTQKNYSRFICDEDDEEMETDWQALWSFIIQFVIIKNSFKLKRKKMKKFISITLKWWLIFLKPVFPPI